MKAWEIWTSNLYGPHPVVLVSRQPRIDQKQRVVVLKCTTLRPGDLWQPDRLQTVLDQEDGLQLRTRCDCDLLFTVEKSSLTQKRGEVQWERRRDISRKIIQALSLAGL